MYNEQLDALYLQYSDGIRNIPDFEGKASFENQVQANIQLMFMGDLTPEEVLTETMDYYENQIKQ